MTAGRRWTLLALIAAGLLTLPAHAGAVGLQPIGSFNQPIFVTSDPAAPNRLLVVERAGLIKLVQGGSVSTFADLTSVVRCCESERGLFSIALPPDFPRTGLFYAFYTGEDGPGNLHIAEMKASGDSAGIDTLRNVLTIPHSQAGNHNGGQLQFGPDGYLYVATGDGGSTPNNAQDRSSLLGKLLRIDPRQKGSQPYSVPQGNPFVGAPGADEIWAYGLRNPFRFSFDRLNGDLLLPDVGESSYEELNFAPASAGLGRGVNYGWNCREGAHPYSSGNPVCAGLSGYTDPGFEYSHAATGGCAITGGYVARDPTLGDLVGRYVYSDLCLGQIRSLVPGLPGGAGDRAEGVNLSSPVSFGEDSCGRLYAVEQGGNVFRFTGSGGLACKVLTVTRSGTGKGAVTGPGIDCPPDCSQVYPLPSGVSLKAHPGKRSNFLRWGGACGGKRRCSVSMNADRTVKAKFKGPLPTRLRLRAPDRSVAAGALALLKVKAKPCAVRRHDRVRLLRGGKRVAAKRLSGRCVAKFHLRVNGRDRFRARIRADKKHRAGKSRKVTIVGS